MFHSHHNYANKLQIKELKIQTNLQISIEKVLHVYRQWRWSLQKAFLEGT